MGCGVFVFPTMVLNDCIAVSYALFVCLFLNNILIPINLYSLQTMHTFVCKQLCVCVVFVVCVCERTQRWILRLPHRKRGKKEFLSIFSVLCHRLNFFPPSLVFAWLCAPIDWQLAPEPLRPLKIPGRGFGFQAPASGPAIVCVWKAGSIRAQPSQPHSACLLCVPPPQSPACYPQGPS